MDASQVRRIQHTVWVLRAQKGDTEAFRALVGAYERRLLYYLQRLIGDANKALDVLQEVWMTVFRRLVTLRSPEAFRVWIYQVAHDKAVSLIRRQRREAAAFESAPNSERIETPDVALTFENVEFVHRALQAISVEHREVLTLRFLEDMQLEEIAEATRMKLGTVKSRLHYAKEALRREMERLDHE